MNVQTSYLVCNRQCVIMVLMVTIIRRLGRMTALRMCLADDDFAYVTLGFVTLGIVLSQVARWMPSHASVCIFLQATELIGLHVR